jgi:hypothetical protein
MFMPIGRQAGFQHCQRARSLKTLGNAFENWLCIQFETFPAFQIETTNSNLNWFRYSGIRRMAVRAWNVAVFRDLLRGSLPNRQ